MIRAPGGSVCFMMFLLWFFRWRSKTFGLLVLLPFKLRLFREPICKIVCFEQCVCLESGQCVSQDMILPKYCFATKSFCQGMILPKYHFATISFCHNIVFAKIWWCQPFIVAHFLGQMSSLIDIYWNYLYPFASQDHPLWVPPSHFSRTMVSTGTITPCKWAKRHPRLRLIFGKCSGS